MAKSPDRPRLRLVPDLPTERRESLRARFGDGDDEQLDRLMKQELGGKIVNIVCGELYVFDNSIRPGVQSLDHQGYNVAGLYMGIEYVMGRSIPVTKNPDVPLEVIDTRMFPLAVFSTATGPLFTEMSDDEVELADLNDTGSASMFQRIGVGFDEPVAFGPLSNNFPEDDELRPVQLRVVQ